jgi:hypothetical protein
LPIGCQQAVTWELLRLLEETKPSSGLMDFNRAAAPNSSLRERVQKIVFVLHTDVRHAGCKPQASIAPSSEPVKPPVTETATP